MGTEIIMEEYRGLFSANSINVDECKCVLIGGEYGIRTLTAVMIENDTVSGAISLERQSDFSLKICKI